MWSPLRVSLGLLLVLGWCFACAASSNRSGEASPSPESAGSPLEGDLLPAELTTIGWDALSNSPVVLLRELESGQVLPIRIGLAEARAIGLALDGIITYWCDGAETTVELPLESPEPAASESGKIA